jgi:hypothetical protein
MRVWFPLVRTELRGSGVTYAFLLPALRQSLLAMVLKHALETLLCKGKCATNIRFQAFLKVLTRLFQEWLLARVLNAIDGHVELQPLEALVCLNVLEGLLQRLFRCVARESFEDGGWVRGAHFADGCIYGIGAAREEGDGKVTVGGRGEDSSDPCALDVGNELSAFCVDG